MSNVCVNFDIMSQNHLAAVTGNAVALAGGSLKSFYDTWRSQNGYGLETCCVELSWAFNNSGAGINDNNSSITLSKARTWTGGDGSSNYIISVPEMKVFLDNEYGLADNYMGGVKSDYAGIVGRKGVLALGYRHISVWDGSNYTHEGHYLDLWGNAVFQSGDNAGTLINASAHNRGIYFWEITSQYGF